MGVTVVVMTPSPLSGGWCRVSALPGVELLLVSALRLAQPHITDNQPQLGRGVSSAANWTPQYSGYLILGLQVGDSLMRPNWNEFCRFIRR